MESQKEQIKAYVKEMLKRSFDEAGNMLDRIIENATEEQLRAPGAACDIYTAIMEDRARQYRTNPRQYSRTLHRESRKRVLSFWWLAQR